MLGSYKLVVILGKINLVEFLGQKCSTNQFINLHLQKEVPEGFSHLLRYCTTACNFRQQRRKDCRELQTGQAKQNLQVATCRAQGTSQSEVNMCERREGVQVNPWKTEIWQVQRFLFRGEQKPIGQAPQTHLMAPTGLQWRCFWGSNVEYFSSRSSFTETWVFYQISLLDMRQMKFAPVWAPLLLCQFCPSACSLQQRACSSSRNESVCVAWYGQVAFKLTGCFPEGFCTVLGERKRGWWTDNEWVALTGAAANTPVRKAQEWVKHYGYLPRVFIVFPISFIKFYVLNWLLSL